MHVRGESDSSIPAMWQCIYSECKNDLPPSREGQAPKYCMFCGGLQLRCVNPGCKEPLFSAKAELCHKCGRSQQISETSSASLSRVAASPRSDDGDLDKANSEMDNGNVATESDATKTKSAEPTPEKSSTHGESSVDLKKPMQESQVTQSTPDAGSNTGNSEPPGDSSMPPALAPEKDPHTQIVDQPRNQASRDSSADQSNDKKPPSPVVSESDASSDREQFHTPPPTPNAKKSHTDLANAGGQQQPPKVTSDKPSSSISDSLKKLSLDHDESSGRKHSLDREESEDSDESNPAKRKALDGGDPSAAATGKADGAQSGQIEDKHEKVKQQKDGKTDKQKKDENGINDLDESENDHPLKEVPVL